MQRPGFWDDSEAASRTAATHKRSQDRLATFRSLEADVADLEELAEMAAEDPDIAGEMEEQLGLLEARLAQLE